jgi:hypothetical protein
MHLKTDWRDVSKEHTDVKIHRFSHGCILRVSALSASQTEMRKGKHFDAKLFPIELLTKQGKVIHQQNDWVGA